MTLPRHDVGVTPAEAQTIASVLSGRLKVKIKRGSQWAYSFSDKTIRYRPADLYMLTEIDVVANLLHEAGHAKYSIAPLDLSYPIKIPLDHQAKLKELVNVIEDFRIEDKLRRAYPYARDYLPLYSFKTLHILNSLREIFEVKRLKVPRYLIYCYGIYDHLAKTETRLAGFDKKVQKKIDLTKGFAKKARYTPNTQKIADIIAKDIYPHIKDLLDEWEEPAHTGIVFAPGDPPIPIYADLYPSIKKLIEPTKARLARVLTDVAFDKYAGNFRTGKKLNRRTLYKFGIPKDKLFERMIKASKKDYVFALVVDLSGSMHRYDQLENAIRTAILFSHVLDKLKIPFSLHGFHAKIHHYKTPSELFTMTSHKIFQKMHDDSHKQPSQENAAFNNDGLALHEASKYLLPFKGKKVMFVISDGKPAPDGDGINYPLKAEIIKTEKKDIKVVGIGIGGEQRVKDYYKTCLVVPEVQNLPTAIISSLRKELS